MTSYGINPSVTVDLFDLRLGFDGTNYEITDDRPTDNVVFKILESDPCLTIQGYGYYGGFEQLGLFISLKMKNDEQEFSEEVWIHEGLIASMYSYDKGNIVCNYHISDSSVHVKTQHGTPLQVVAEGQSSARWGDEDSEDDIIIFNAVDAEKGKISEMPPFTNSYFDKNVGKEDEWIDKIQFKDRFGRLPNGQMILLDYVRIFINPARVSPNLGNKKFLEAKVRQLAGWSKSLYETKPMSEMHGDESDWSSNMKFYIQSLDGLDQVPFLLVTLFYSIRRVVTADNVLKLKLNQECKDFFTKPEMLQQHFVRVITLKKQVIQNNDTILLNVNAAKEAGYRKTPKQ